MAITPLGLVIILGFYTLLCVAEKQDGQEGSN